MNFNYTKLKIQFLGQEFSSVAQHLPSVHEALSPIPAAQKRKNIQFFCHAIHTSRAQNPHMVTRVLDSIGDARCQWYRTFCWAALYGQST